MPWLDILFVWKGLAGLLVCGGNLGENECFNN